MISRVERGLFCVLALAALCAPTMRAGDVIVDFDHPNQSGTAGSTLQYFGTIINADPVNPVFLNADDLNFAGSPNDFAIDDLFLLNAPASLAGGLSTGDIELFDVTLNFPFSGAFTTYSGTYTLSGGVDEYAEDVLTDPAISFSATAISPEPGSFALLLGGLAAVAALCRRG